MDYEFGVVVVVVVLAAERQSMVRQEQPWLVSKHPERQILLLENKWMGCKDRKFDLKDKSPVEMRYWLEVA